MNDFSGLTLGIGVALSMLYAAQTGYGSGGLISAGMLALSLNSPRRIAGTFLLALALCPMLRFGVQRWGWYGRSRIGWAMLLSVVLRWLAGFLVWPVPAVGWVIPGLIASDIERQGALETVSALVSVSVATAFAAEALSVCLVTLNAF